MIVIVIEECQLILHTVTFKRYYVFFFTKIVLCVQQYRCSSTYLLDVPVYPIESWVTFMTQILNSYFSLLYLNSYYVDKKRKYRTRTIFSIKQTHLEPLFVWEIRIWPTARKDLKSQQNLTRSRPIIIFKTWKIFAMCNFTV